MEIGEDLIIHYNSLQGTGYRTLEEGQSVTLSIVQSERGEHAADVEIVD